MSDSVRPHRWKLTRLPRPWDSPGKDTGVSCHFLLQCIKVKSESEVAQSCLTLCDSMDCTVHRILQVTILEWIAIPFSRGSSQPRDQTQVFPHCRKILYQLSHKGNPRILEWVAYPFSSKSSRPRNWTKVSCIADGFFTNWAIREACHPAYLTYILSIMWNARLDES